MKEVEPKIYTVKLTQEQCDAIIDAFVILDMVPEIETEFAAYSTKFASVALPALCDSLEKAGFSASELFRIE
jgi:hypothetical protein